MERLLIVDDTHCKTELDNFIKTHRKHLTVNSSSELLIENFTKLNSIIPARTNNNQRLLINMSNCSVLVKVNEVIRCKSNRNYTELFLQNGQKLTVTKPLKQFAQLKSLANFARIHLSHLVNIDHIDRFIKTGGGMVVLSDGTKIPVSVRRKEELLKKIQSI